MRVGGVILLADKVSFDFIENELLQNGTIEEFENHLINMSNHNYDNCDLKEAVLNHISNALIF